MNNEGARRLRCQKEGEHTYQFDIEKRVWECAFCHIQKPSCENEPIGIPSMNRDNHIWQQIGDTPTMECACCHKQVTLPKIKCADCIQLKKYQKTHSIRGHYWLSAEILVTTYACKQYKQDIDVLIGDAEPKDIFEEKTCFYFEPRQRFHDKPKAEHAPRKTQQTCPKCGLLGSGWKDKRGYTRFQHFIDGRRRVCYIGKV